MREALGDLAIAPGFGWTARGLILALTARLFLLKPSDEFAVLALRRGRRVELLAQPRILLENPVVVVELFALLLADLDLLVLLSQRLGSSRSRFGELLQTLL